MSHFNTSIYKWKSQKLLESGALPKIILQVTRRVMYPLIKKKYHWRAYYILNMVEDSKMKKIQTIFDAHRKFLW